LLFRLVPLLIAALAIVAACEADPLLTEPTRTPEPAASSTAAATPAGPSESAATGGESPAPTEGQGSNSTPDVPASGPVPPSEACASSSEHRAFFRQAAASMGWPVYCAVLSDGWFLEAGSYRLADGGRLEVTYRGPGAARLSLVEGNVCAGTEVDVCAPRDIVIGPAAFGDREGVLGRLANGLVLDVDRGATPSWRATGLGLTEAEFQAIVAAVVKVEG